MSDRAHWLRPLTAERWPRRHVYLDAEAVQDDAGRFVYLVGCAIAAVDPEGIEIADRVAWTPDELWGFVDRMAAPRGETRVWTHGLEYDLAVTQARSNLLTLGWRPERFAIREHGGWWQWRRGDRRLVLADSMSFLGNAALRTVAADLGMPDPPQLPTIDAGPDAWVARVKADAWILRAALRRVMGWYEQEGIGGLQLSGASQGMAAYRRRWMPPRRILVHADQAAREAEREATWSGRCEAWRWGVVTEPLEEWDYALCYPRIAARAVPVRLCERPRAAAEGYVLLERGIARTELPTTPTRTPRGVVYPIGTFATTLWQPEIELLRRSGGTWETQERWQYAAEPVLRDWSEWITDQAENHPSQLVRRVTKQWARTVIGSFGLRYPVWEVWAEDTEPDRVQLMPYTDGTHDGSLLFLGGVAYLEADVRESENAVPQIQSYVWSCARVALWEAMIAAGLENVVYVDTDSVIVTTAGGDRLRSWSGGGVDNLVVTGSASRGGLGDPVRRPPLRIKQRYPWAEIHGSRQILFPRGETRISGLKRGAQRVGPTAWEAEVWESGLAAPFGGLEHARTVRRRFTIRRGDLRRDRRPGGYTDAISVR